MEERGKALHFNTVTGTFSLPFASGPHIMQPALAGPLGLEVSGWPVGPLLAACSSHTLLWVAEAGNNIWTGEH